MHYNGVWGTVCDDGWDLNDAQVVCTELDDTKAIAAGHNAFYGEGSGQIWLDDVNCVGTEETIRNCSHSGWGSHNCSHEKDAIVKCIVGRYVDHRYMYDLIKEKTIIKISTNSYLYSISFCIC